MSAVLLIAGFAKSQSAFGQVSSAGDASHFRYDGSASLGVNVVSSKTEAGVTVENITYRGANGDTVPTHLVVPPGTGKFAAVVWGHWLMPGAANSNWDEFLSGHSCKPE